MVAPFLYTFVTMKTQNSKNIFLVDGIGAVVSFVFLVIIKFFFQEAFGFNGTLLNICIGTAATLLLLDIIAFMRYASRNMLAFIVTLNSLYACFTLGYLMVDWDLISLLGKCYLVIELLILWILIYLEIQQSKGQLFVLNSSNTQHMINFAKSTFLIVLCSLGLTAASQEEGELKHWEIGIYFSPDLTHHQLFFSEQVGPLVVDWRQNAKPGFGFNAGISVNCTITPRVELVSGFGFIRFSDRIVDIPIVQEFNEFVGEEDRAYQYNYASIPLRLNVHAFSNEKIACYITAGGSANLFFFSQVKSTMRFDDGSSSSQKEDFDLYEVNTFGIMMQGGVGVRYDV